MATATTLCHLLDPEDFVADFVLAIGWVSEAHSAGPVDNYLYYPYWQRAFNDAATRGKGDIAILAVPVLMVGAIRGRCRPDQDYQRWFEDLINLATTPGRR